MSKPIIAVDIDDVLAAEAEFIIGYSNKTWGYDLDLEDYTEDWSFWGISSMDKEFELRADELHQPGIQGGYRVIEDAVKVIKKLKVTYDLIIVTSRRIRSEAETLQWIEKHFGDVFDRIVFTGFWDNVDDPERHLRSKGGLLADHGVDYLIDDQPKHCLSAAEYGVKAVLFGGYAQNRGTTIPSGVTRCKNWQEVAEYFGV